MSSTQTSFFKHTLAPLILLLLCPPTVFAFWYTNVHLEGSLLRFGEFAWQQGLFSTLKIIWFPYFFGTSTAWTILVFFAAFELILMRFLPGKAYEGPITPSGQVPLYKANGLPAFIITIACFSIASFYYRLFSPTIIYDHLPGLLGALNIFSLCFCLFLLIKGYVNPSSRDVGGSGNIIFDYYWGMELYPRLFGWDIKQFTNCRFGMMGWPLIIISFAAKQQELYGLSDSMLVAVTLQLIYITKFFIWEPGYLRSLDIMHDRAGYYICWGCLVWVPSIYTSPTLYLVNHPNHLGSLLTTLLLSV
jgi:7-dehydrocholesterol reductase